MSVFVQVSVTDPCVIVLPVILEVVCILAFWNKKEYNR